MVTLKYLLNPHTMDYKSKTRKAGGSPIGSSEAYELQYRFEKSDVARQRLKEAAAAAGTGAEKVTEYTCR